MEPSSKYATDTYVDYGNGARYPVTKSVNTLYSLNDETDLSICYTNYISDALTHINQNVDPYNSETDTSASYGTIERSIYSRTLKDWIRRGINSNVYAGFALYHSGVDDLKYYMWGYNPAGTVKGDADGKFVHDIDFNHMIIPIGNISVRDRSAYDNIDYETYPEVWHGSATAPSDYNISLSTLDANPDNYLISDYNYGNAYVYASDNNSWIQTAIRPILMFKGDTVGGICAFRNPFLGFYNTSVEITTTSPTGDPSTGGGGVTTKVTDKLLDGYSLGFTKDFDFKQTTFDDIDEAEAWGQAKYQSIYGSTYGSHNFYFEHQEIDLGDSLLCIQYYIHIEYSGWYPPPYISCNYQLRMKGSFIDRYLAGMGLYFSNDGSIPSGITPLTLHTSDKIWLGAMNADGTTSGTWVKGADIYTYNGYNKVGNTANPGYEPGAGGGGSDEDNEDAVNTAGAPYAKGLVNYYAMTAGSPLIDHISEALSTWDLRNTGKDLYKNLVSCKLIKPPAAIPTSGSEPLTIYGEKPQYQGADITLPVVSGNPVASFGPYSISRKFNDFRDYAPYTRVSIFLPYCGWCDLPSHVVGRSVTVKYFTDIISATVRAVVFCGNNIVAEAAGVMGLDIPFTADAVGMKQAGVVSGLTAYAGGALQTAAGVAQLVTSKDAKGLSNVFSGGSKLLSAYSQTAQAFNENTTEISGKNGDGCCLSGATNIIIKIIRPKYGASSDPPFVPAGFAHSVGFVSNKQVRVGNVSGLLVADNVDTSGIAGATDAERAEIRRVLETGLIVNAAPE